MQPVHFFTRRPHPWITFVTSLILLSTAQSALVITGRGVEQVDLRPLTERQLGEVKASSFMGCARGDMIVRLGDQWKERCGNCTCTESGKVCDKKCPIEYDSSQEVTCAKWSSDNCCCEQLGCPLPDGSIIPINERMPFDPAKPCHTCTCMGGTITNCLVTMCPPLKCVDPRNPPYGQCCPECPNGPTCTLPLPAHIDFPAEAMQAEPIASSLPVTLGLGTRKQMTCACNGGLIAVCNRSFQQENINYHPF